ncbi:MAG: hypothetical protein RL199_1674 [Pseudomonadota bacterium]
MRTPIVWLLSASLVVSAACTHKPAAGPPPGGSPKTDGGTGTTPTGVALGDFCRVVATITCDALAGCRCPSPGSVAACVAAQESGCERDLESSFAGVALDALRYDGAQAKACLDAYRTELAACRNPGRVPAGPACRRAFLDAASPGGSCTTFGEGHGCAAGTGLCEPGTKRCVALPGSGAPCLAGACAEGFACDGDLCRAPESLGLGALGEACIRQVDCAGGLACVGGQCLKTVPFGGDCEIDSGACGSGGLCQPPAAPRACQSKLGAGGRCMGADDCAAGLSCLAFAFPGVCVADVPVGGGCHSESICAAGSICSPLTNECTMPPTLGEACLSGLCGPGLACIEQTCQLTGDVGATCWSPLQCRSGLACDRAAGVCSLTRAGGESCSGGPELCGENFYCAASEQICRPRAPRGGACMSDAECPPGLLCSGTCKPPPDTLGAACDKVCGGDLRCASMPGTCVGAACALAR